MSAEEKIKLELVNKFKIPTDNIRITRDRRLWADVDSGIFMDVFKYAFENLKFKILCTITGFDDKDKLSAMYHLAQDCGIMLNLKVSVPKENPVIKTVTSFFPSADAYEREMVDLLGMKVDGLPPGNRYPLTDDWPECEYPLRKDWKPSTSK